MSSEKTQAVSMEKVPSAKTISISEIGIDYIFKTSRTLAKLMFVWPIKAQPSVIHDIIIFIGNVVCTLLIIFELANSTLNIIYVLPTFQYKLVNGPYLVYTIMSLFIYLCLWSARKDIKNCIMFVQEDCQNFQNEEQRDLMIKNIQLAHYLSIGMGIFVYGGGLWYYVIAPALSHTYVTERNITIRPFPAPTYGAYATHSPNYELVFALQLVIQFILMSTNSVAFCYASTFTLHACGQFDILILEFDKLISGTERSQLNDTLIQIFKHHLRILKFISHLKDCVSGICFVEVSGYTILICLLSYVFIIACKDKNVNLLIPMGMFILSAVFNMFIYSYIGELLTTKAIEVGECAYMVKWYDIPKSVSLNLIHMIRMSHFPSQLTAGKFFILSMYTFGFVMKSGAVYCNFIWSMVE